MAGRIPVLLDTDIGSDIDDAVALSYLLKQPRCELLGVTTVAGDVAQRAACAEVVCRAAGREDVPIHCGASEVLVHGPGQAAVPQYQAIVDRPHRRDWPANTAVDFLRQTINSRPGEITLLSIGPLTNVALLYAIDPECARKIKRVVSMVGDFFGKPEDREWNALVDPVATAITYRHSHNHTSVGIDVTRQCKMLPAEVRERFTASPLDVVLLMAEVWFRNRKALTFHDPLAATLLFRPEICTFVEGEVSVSLADDEKQSGHTRFTPAEGGRHRVAREVNAEAFFTEFFSVFD